MPRHFCHILASFDPGGFELRTVELMNALGARVRHTIIATNGTYGAAQRIRDDVSFEIVPPPTGKGALSYPLKLREVLTRVRPNLLLTYNWGAIDAVAGAVIGSRICPVIHAEDGFGPEESAGLKSRRIWARRLLLKRVNAVVVPSRVLARIAAQQFRVPPARLNYIPNGVDADRFRDEHDLEWRRQHGIPDDAVLCGTVGRMRPEKNLGLLLEAFVAANVPELRLALAGDGPESDALKRRCREIDRQGHIVFAGNLSDPASFYRSLDFFVMSSVTEQMPVALLEAMSSGLAVLATDVGDIREMLGQTATPTTLANSGDIQALAEGLRKLALDAAFRRTLGSRNRQTVVERYTVSKMVERYRGLYEAVLSSAI